MTDAADSGVTQPQGQSDDQLGGGLFERRSPSNGANPDELLKDHNGRARFARRLFAEKRPKRVRDVLAQVFAKRGYAAVRGAEALAEAWAAAVPAEYLRMTRVAGLRAGKLEVVVASSAVVEELGFRKREILAAVRDAAPTARISDLRLRVGSIDT
ncbi:MAG: DciA family protein [Lacipirellulaceae bacterium]